jgi:UTP pyrophosphatase
MKNLLMPPQALKYLSGYPDELLTSVQDLIDQKKLSQVILKKFPHKHDINTDKALYEYTMSIKNRYLRKTRPLSKVLFDNKITLKRQALGLHSFVSRVQGKKLKAKNEIRIAAVLKSVPIEFLRAIVVHELAHLKEKEHNKAFYKLCKHMEPDYHQYEFDLRLYLTHLDLIGPLF